MRPCLRSVRLHHMNGHHLSAQAYVILELCLLYFTDGEFVGIYAQGDGVVAQISQPTMMSSTAAAAIHGHYFFMRARPRGYSMSLSMRLICDLQPQKVGFFW